MKAKKPFYRKRSGSHFILFCFLFLIPFCSISPQIKQIKNIKKPLVKATIKKIPKVGILKSEITLTNPINGDQSVPTNVVLEWNPITEASSYTLKYLSVENQENTLSPFTVISDINNTSYELSLENGKVYHWSVSAIDPSGKLYESNLYSFTTVNSTPNIVSAISPQNLETNVNTNVTLSWTPVTDPDGDTVYYNVLLNKDFSFVEFEEGYAEGVVVSSLQTQTNFQISLEPGTNYFWRIESRDEKGGRTRSPIWSFKTSPVTWTTPITAGSFTDTRDNKTYQTVTIGNQTWMAENLAYLPYVNNPNAQLYTDPKYKVLGYYGNSVEEAKTKNAFQKYGVYYNFLAANSACPVGWHLPSDVEWKELEVYLGMAPEDLDRVFSERGRVVAGLLREVGTTSWVSTNDDVNNLALFNSRPSGWASDYSWNNVGIGSVYWTSSNYNSDQAYARSISMHSLNYQNISLNRMGTFKHYYSCVRCIRD